MDLTILRGGVVALLAVSFGAIVTVMRLHWMAYIRLPRTAGLIPLHVALVSLHVLLTQGALAWALIEQLATQSSTTVAIRTAVYGLSSAVLLAALYVVGAVQRRRLEFARTEKTIIVETLDEIAGSVERLDEKLRHKDGS